MGRTQSGPARHRSRAETGQASVPGEETARGGGGIQSERRPGTNNKVDAREERRIDLASMLDAGCSHAMRQ